MSLAVRWSMVKIYWPGIRARLLDLNVGYQFQVCNKRLVLGPEISFGIVRGNLEYDDPTQGINVQYRNHTQRSLGGIIGLVIGSDKNSLVYVYTNEIKDNLM